MWVSGAEPSPFMLDPLVKEEHVWVWDGGARHGAAERKNDTAWLRDADGVRVAYPVALRGAESVLSQLQDPHRYPLVSALRQELLTWRFYHHFRTDADAPVRHPQIGIQTPVLSHDGADLAAALATIRQLGDERVLQAAIARAFPGHALRIEVSSDTRFVVTLHTPGIKRALRGTELSDGTLRYLCLLAALMSPRPPPFLALNEPETSLHPDLLAPLAELIADAAKRSQVLVTTHAEPLADALRRAGATIVRLRKGADGTEVEGAA
jgi:predicted ATPase